MSVYIYVPRHLCSLYSSFVVFWCPAPDSVHAPLFHFGFIYAIFCNFFETLVLMPVFVIVYGQLAILHISTILQAF